MEHEKEISEMRQEHQARLDKIENHILAETLLSQSHYDEESTILNTEITSLLSICDDSTTKSLNESETLLLDLRAQIHERRGKVTKMKSQILQLTSTKHGLHESDEFRKGRITTPFDRQIQEAESAMTDTKLDFEIQVKRLDEQYSRAKVLDQFSLKKIRNQIQGAKQKCEAAKTQIEVANEDYKGKMAVLREKIMGLAAPKGKKVRTPDHKRVRTMGERSDRLEKEVEEVEVVLDGRARTLAKLQENNKKLQREVKRRQFLADYPVVEGSPVAKIGRTS
jgi:hypothetical protein